MSETPAPTPETTATETGGSPEWFCDQCGARYFGPGVCANAHEPTQLKNLAEAQAAEDATAASPVEAPPVTADATPPVEVPTPAMADTPAEPPSAPPEKPPIEPAAPLADAHSQAAATVAEARSLVERAVDLLRSL